MSWLYAWLGLGCLALNLIGASNYDLLTDDEIRYAEAGRRMLETGDWILPEYNGYPRYQKPILFYWLQALSQWQFGSTPWAARLPAALAGVGVVLLTAQLSRAIWGRRAGVWAGVALALSVEMLLLARMAMTDVVLLLFLQGACNCFCFAYMRKRVGMWQREAVRECKSADGRITMIAIGQSSTRTADCRWLYRGMYCCLALGVLTKGPIALALPTAVVIPWLIRQKQLIATFRRMRLAEGLLILLVIAGPWYAWVDWHTYGQFTRHFFLEENVGRFTTVINDHHQPALFYWLLLVPMTFPWTGLLPSAIGSCLRELTAARKNDRAFTHSLSDSLASLFLWQIAVVLALFSFSQTKVWTYILPAFPALALLTGRWLAIHAKHRAAIVAVRWGSLRVFSWLFAGLSLGVAAAATIWPLDRLPLELQGPNVLANLQWCLWLLFLLSAIVFVVLRRGTVQQSAVVLACGAGIWYLAACFSFLPAYDRHWKQPVREVGATIRQFPHANAIVYRLHELAMNTYGSVPIVRQWRGGCREGLQILLSCQEPVFLLCPAEHLPDLEGLNFHRWGENPRFVWGANFPKGFSGTCPVVPESKEW